MKKNKKDDFLEIEDKKSSCCFLKSILTLSNLASFGSLATLLFLIFFQIYTLSIGFNNFAYISIIFNIFFIVIVLQKIKVLNFEILTKIVNPTLKFLMFLYILNAVLSLFLDDILYNFVISPLNIFGAYFIFLLLKRDSI